MAKLSDEIITKVLELEKQLLLIINESTKTTFTILEIYGETETTIIALDDLDNARERAYTYYSRLHNILGKIAESQPMATNVMLTLLNRSIEEAEATIEATQATIIEEKRSFNLS
ncbi:hypothetical protein [Geminocystis herdmanii]|uniref:hypothetical protein n=1 Tax=Geminocystis herdmanii TaxID=669359 RepID=UPI00035D25C8|nr:hypothetical protein [Geminocystis herdmanii]